MMLLRQLRNKIRTHGLALTLGYSLVHAARSLWDPVWRRVGKSYSQAEEDRLLDRLLEGQRTGFYVDIGAHHPVRLSNTKRFYDRGWCGINVEPSPAAQAQFVRQRPRDINLCCGAGGQAAVLDYYDMQDAKLSSFDPEQAARAQRMGARLKQVHRIPVRTLADIFAEYVRQPVDFLSIDIEGLEEEVLRGNDWERWRPRFICIEAVRDEDIREEPVLQQRDRLFEALGYRRRAVVRNLGRVLNAVYEDGRERRTD